MEDLPQDIKLPMSDEEFQKRIDALSKIPLDYRGGHPNITPEQSKARLRELILYIADQSKDDPNFTIEKLEGLLYIIDMESYKKTGQSITGSIYIKKDRSNEIHP